MFGSCVFVICVCLCVGWTSSVTAQVGSGEITGLVRDATGAPLPGATVSVTALDTQRERVIVTTTDGVYTAAGLPPGAYRLDTRLAGFDSYRRDELQVATGEKL